MQQTSQEVTLKKILAVALMIAALGVGAFAAETIKIGVSIPTADHGWTGGINYWAQVAIDDWKAQDPDIEFFLVTAASPADQVAQVEDLMVKGIDALVILAHDSAPLTPIVKEAHEAGIFVVSVDRGLTEPVEDIYIAGDNPGLGRVSAEWIAKEMNYEGNLVVLEGIPCVINTERVDAFNAVMAKYPNITILDSQPAYWQAEKGLEVMENYLQKYQQIDAVWAQDDDIMQGVLQAYQESGRNDIHTILGGAGAKWAVKMIMDGDPLVRADVTYPPNMIATGVSAAVMSLRHIQLNGFYQFQFPSKVILAAELVTPENAAEYYEPDSIF